jgi:hypothetical protein
MSEGLVEKNQIEETVSRGSSPFFFCKYKKYQRFFYRDVNHWGSFLGSVSRGRKQ